MKFLCLFKKFVFVTSIAFVSFCFFSSSYATELQNFKQSNPFVKLVQDTYNNMSLDLIDQSPKKQNCQTLTYLNRPQYRKQVTDAYKDKIDEIGKETFEKLVNDVLSKELELKDEYYVLYHGCKIDFLLFQDLFEKLYQIFYKQAFLDFVMLRIPDKSFKKIKTIKTFLETYKENNEINEWDFDEHPNIKKVLLSVNPSLFGNSSYCGESTFYYFINSSNASYIRDSSLIEENFGFFKILDLYKKYENDLNELSRLLSIYEDKKSGTLLQIFIPKKIIDDICYRSKPWGLLHYEDSFNEISPSQEFENYQNDLFTQITFTEDPLDEQMQFRLLLNKNIMLNPKSGVKIFRYYNETKNTKLYQKKFTEFLDQISQEINKPVVELKQEFKNLALA